MDFEYLTRRAFLKMVGLGAATLALPLRMCQTTGFSANFEDVSDRIWIGRDFWAVPMEEWRVQNGRVEGIGQRANTRLNVLTHVLGPAQGDLSLSVRMGTIRAENNDGSAGVRVGIVDSNDPDPRAACYFGRGIDAGVDLGQKHLFINNSSAALPAAFDYSDFTLQFSAAPDNSQYSLTLTATDGRNQTATVHSNAPNLQGLVALVNNFTRPEEDQTLPGFWFNDLHLSGSKVEAHPDNAFGPILWSIYTLSRGVLKITAQMPPLGAEDTKQVRLQIQRNNSWELVDEQTIDPDSRTAIFRLTGWDPTRAVPYRLVYTETRKNGQGREYTYRGAIRRDPVDTPLVFGGMTCQYGTGFPYSPVAKNLEAKNPDILYFSGDQIYEGNGGYGITRFPADAAILNYLGKWYMFGWAFGDLMRDRPTVCTPDDHDVFHGNLWGDGGRKIPFEEWQQMTGDKGGYVEPARMVNVVHTTQCGHLPDPVDPAPIQQGIKVYYTDLVYGRVSFAIISDRMFKTGPREVAYWPGRADHLKEHLSDPSVLDKPGLNLLGDRQLDFLEQWVTDWRGADMKVLLSQTPFANIATHHGGNQMVLVGDLDSGGWPKSGRDRAIEIFRKAFAFHITGDQHFPTISQYGIDDYRDSGWCLCTPAIFVGYERRFLPERLGWPIKNPPDPNRSNTGYYEDAFGNLTYVYAVGNPEDKPSHDSRYRLGQDRASGFSLVRFDQAKRTIAIEAYHFLADLNKQNAENQFPGWPYTISQWDNYGRQPAGYLPTVQVSGTQNPVIMVTNETTGDLEYAVRMQGNEWSPKVFSTDQYTVKVGDPDTDLWKTKEHLTPQPEKPAESLTIDL